VGRRRSNKKRNKELGNGALSLLSDNDDQISGLKILARLIAQDLRKNKTCREYLRNNTESKVRDNMNENLP